MFSVNGHQARTPHPASHRTQVLCSICSLLLCVERRQCHERRNSSATKPHAALVPSNALSQRRTLCSVNELACESEIRTWRAPRQIHAHLDTRRTIVTSFLKLLSFNSTRCPVRQSSSWLRLSSFSSRFALPRCGRVTGSPLLWLRSLDFASTLCVISWTFLRMAVRISCFADATPHDDELSAFLSSLLRRRSCFWW
jgi:hypothetical protein